jgi:hypothetical protein
MVLFFNKRIFDELGYEYPYETVKDGEWTFDEFAYYARKGAADLNGDGVMKLEDDRFGFVSGTWMAPINILYAGGGKVYDKNDEGRIELTLFSNKTVDLFSEFFSLMDTAGCEIIPDEYDGPAIYTAGRAMFSTSTMDTAIAYRSMDDDFGILPYPKGDAEQAEYCNTLHAYGNALMCIPDAADPEMSAAVMETMSYYGRQELLPAYYDITLVGKGIRDEDSEEMLDIIFTTRFFDVGTYYQVGGLNETVNSLVSSGSASIAPVLKATEKMVNKTLEKINAGFAGME